MDLPLYLRVLWSKKFTVLLGLICATVATVLSAYRVDVEDRVLVPRAAPEYESSARLLIGQADQGLFQSRMSTPQVTGVTVRQGYSPQALAELYAYLIVSDDFQSRLRTITGPLAGGERVSAVRRLGSPTDAPAPANVAADRSVIPVLEIQARAASADRARVLAQSATDAFLLYFAQEQEVNRVPDNERVTLTVLRSATRGQSLTKSPVGTMVLVFAAVLGAFLALAFVGHNVQDRRVPLQRVDARREDSLAGSSLQELEPAQNVRWFRRD